MKSSSSSAQSSHRTKSSRKSFVKKEAESESQEKEVSGKCWGTVNPLEHDRWSVGHNNDL